MKRTVVLLLILMLLLTGCSTAQAAQPEAPSAPGETEVRESPVTTEPPAVTEPPVATEPPAVSEPPVTTEPPVITEPPIATEAPVITEPPVVTEPPVTTEPPATTEPPVVSQPAPTQPPAPATTWRPTSSATCQDTGSNDIWENTVYVQLDYYEERDPERALYLQYLMTDGNDYYFWLQEEDMRMYLGITYGMPLYTSYDIFLQCSWVSSDPSVATVNELGFVVPLKEGETVVTVTRTDPEIQESTQRECRVRVEKKPEYTFAQLEQMAKEEAKAIADYVMNEMPLSSDLERISVAAYIVNQYVAEGHSTSYVPGYNQPFGTLVTGYSSCAGSTRALGLVLEYMGFQWYHTNENQWSHQWCVVYDVDGQTAFADGSVLGIAGYGERQEDGSNWLQYRNGSLVPAG